MTIGLLRYVFPSVLYLNTEGKTARDRDVSVTSEAKSVLIELHREAEQESFVFHGRKTGLNLADVGF
jgi:hypothetical protein